MKLEDAQVISFLGFYFKQAKRGLFWLDCADSVSWLVWLASKQDEETLQSLLWYSWRALTQKLNQLLSELRTASSPASAEIYLQ